MEQTLTTNLSYLISSLLLLALPFSAEMVAADETVPLQQVCRGQHSGVAEARQCVISDAAQWRSLWAEVHANRTPTPPLPDIDFTESVVLAVFLGRRSTGGHAVAIPHVRRNGDDVVARIRVTAPPPDAMVTMALTQPFVMVAIPRPAGKVVFEKAD